MSRPFEGSRASPACSVLCLLAVVLLAGPAAAEENCPGVRVASVEGSQELQAEDVLVSWRFVNSEHARGIEASGRLCSPFDVWRLNLEIYPRGSAEVSYRRAGSSGDSLQIFVAPPLPYRSLRPRPLLEADLEALLERAEPLRSDTSAEATAAWRELITAASRAPLADRIWILQERGLGLVRRGDDDEGGRLLAESVELADRGGLRWIASHLLFSRARSMQSSNLDGALALFDQAHRGWLAIGRQASAVVAQREASVALYRQLRYNEALERTSGAIETALRVAPHAAMTSGLFGNQGAMRASMGDLECGVESFERALRVARGGFEDRGLSSAINNLAGAYGLVG